MDKSVAIVIGIMCLVAAPIILSGKPPTSPYSDTRDKSIMVQSGVEIVAGLVGIGGIVCIIVGIVTPSRRCPLCRKGVHKEAVKCPYCQSIIVGREPPK